MKIPLTSMVAPRLSIVSQPGITRQPRHHRGGTACRAVPGGRWWPVARGRRRATTHSASVKQEMVRPWRGICRGYIYIWMNPYGVWEIYEKYYGEYLDGGIPSPLKNMTASWDDDIPNIWKHKKKVPNHQPDTICGFPYILHLILVKNGIKYGCKGFHE